MTNEIRIRRLLACDRRLEHVPEAIVATVARQASPRESDAELLIRCADGCTSQARQYRRGGWHYRAGALEKLAFRLQFRLQQAANKETARDA
jgi:hypothetical protein